jgi:predicted dipeptidase
VKSRFGKRGRIAFPIAAMALLFLTWPATVLAGQTAGNLQRTYRDRLAAQLEPRLCELVRFQTVAGNDEARIHQARWLAAQADRLDLVHRDAGLVTEIELPGSPDAPVLGLVVHGDVQPAGETGWTVPPFQCTRKGGDIYGRGVADDKGPLVQALLALGALKADPRPRTHTVRLLVGSDEESANQDFATYLKSHKPPDLTLVLDSEFPVVVGEKAWDALTLTVSEPYKRRGTPGASWVLIDLDAGVSPSIVPHQAVARLRWASANRAGVERALEALCPTPVPAGYSCRAARTPEAVVLTVTGRAAHSGMNLAGGRNALVVLANILQGRVESCGAADLLEFAAIAGKDLYGGGLDLQHQHPLWGRYGVNVAMLKPAEGGGLTLTTNLRRIPPMNGKEIREHLAGVVSRFAAAKRIRIDVGGFFEDEPFAVSPEAPLVRRLMAAYERATGRQDPPAIAGGGTYAKRLPNAIAFGMWFPGLPYPGHDLDERVAVADLHKGVEVLLEALNDLAYSPPIAEPLKPAGIGPRR